mgnify:CR=1 FL=1
MVSIFWKWRGTMPARQTMRRVLQGIQGGGVKGSCIRNMPHLHTSAANQPAALYAEHHVLLRASAAVAGYYAREANDQTGLLKLLYQTCRALVNPHIPNRLIRHTNLIHLLPHFHS